MTEIYKKVREHYREQIEILLKLNNGKKKPYTSASISDFWKFLKIHPTLNKCKLTMNLSSLLHASWDDEISHFGLCFHGDRTCTYTVIRYDERQAKPEHKKIIEVERIRIIEVPEVLTKHKLRELIFRKTH